MQKLLTLLTVLALMTSQQAFAEPKLSKIFKNKKPIIAVINVPALPGQKNFVSMEKAIDAVLVELAILEE